MGGNSYKIISAFFAFTSEIGSTLKKKEFAPLGSKFFLFRVDYFPEWACT